ncbi:hypothetical protein B7755_007380 [Streptomyces sp. NBS 14/10]|uniref:LamG domain-containing protein n=1 Tax=Streptomyces sp. NBS 14/10 TaxID=1945643 RepID=UPI000B7C8F02|nr:LamG domain-containing protein [Streptomyces sp. NBS 14/10]KAK1177986.1 hypothetical protein B7755_007380 [Streptomyces sp. NBS 14/10]
MGRKREFKGTAAQQAMARFLVDVTESIGLDTTAKVAERFPRAASRSTWAEYLNGAKLIPKDLLGQVLMEVRRRRPERWREGLIAEAHTLWKSADESAVSPQDGAGSELVSVYRKLAENAEALRKAQEVEMRSERVIRLMNQRAIQQEMRIAGLEREVEHLQEKEREQAAYRLDQARFRLSRIEDELERARGDRYTVEQAQRALLREKQEIRREFEQLQQAAADLDLPEESERKHLPELLVLEVSEEETDLAVDEELDRVGMDREERELLLSDVLGHNGAATQHEEDDDDDVLTGTVVVNSSTPPQPADQPDSPGIQQDAPRGRTRRTVALWGFAALAAAGLPTGIYLTRDRAPEPVAVWPLDERRKAKIAKDTTGRYNGTATSVGWGQGSGGAALFDGHSSRVTTAGPVLRTGRGHSYTVSVWAWLDTLDTATEFATVVSQSAGDLTAFFLQYWSKPNRWAFSGPKDDFRVQSSVEAVPNRWTHLVGVCNKGTLTLYVDGKQVGADDSANIAMPESGTDQLIIGGAGLAREYGDTYKDFFPGSIKNVQVFDRPLTPDEIKALG